LYGQVLHNSASYTQILIRIYQIAEFIGDNTR